LIKDWKERYFLLFFYPRFACCGLIKDWKERY